jgi:hypothetical protein
MFSDPAAQLRSVAEREQSGARQGPRPNQNIATVAIQSARSQEQNDMKSSASAGSGRVEREIDTPPSAFPALGSVGNGDEARRGARPNP